MVKQFHTAFGIAMPSSPTLLSPSAASARLSFINEEVGELYEAIEAGDLVAIADALGDICVFAEGTASLYGIDMDRVRLAIHNSNMSKLDSTGKPIIRESDGKIMKGPNYLPPDLSFLLPSAEVSIAPADSVPLPSSTGSEEFPLLLQSIAVLLPCLSTG